MRFDKLIFVVSAAALVTLTFFMAGLYSAHKKNAAYRWILDNYIAIKEVYHTYREESFPASHLQPSRGYGEGVTVGADLDDGSLIFMTGFFNGSNGLRLIRRDGTIVADWPVDYFTLFPDRSYISNAPVESLLADIHGAVIHPNGDIAFNFEYLGTVALDRCGHVRWTRASRTHHSMEITPDGGYLLLDRRATPKDDRSYSPLAGGYWEDMALKLSRSGDVEREFSIPRAMFDGGMKAILTASFRTQNDREYRDRELIHANHIDELKPEMADAFPMFRAGDFLVSDKFSNEIAVIDGQSEKLKWFQVGPFLQQHDAEFRADGKIVLFNNNGFDTAAQQYGAPSKTQLTNIMAVDPETHEAEVIYGDKPGQQLFSIIRGMHQDLPDGMLITEFEGGRVLQVDNEGRKVWEFVNPYDETHVGEVTGADLFSKDYFTVSDWSCN